MDVVDVGLDVWCGKRIERKEIMNKYDELVRRNPDILKQLPNLLAPIVGVKYASLKVWDENSPAYKRECPVCEHGILLVQRNDDLTISKFDQCVSCGQAFEYTDFDDVFEPENNLIRESPHKISFRSAPQLREYKKDEHTFCSKCGKEITITSDFVSRNGVICNECAH